MASNLEEEDNQGKKEQCKFPFLAGPTSSKMTTHFRRLIHDFGLTVYVAFGTDAILSVVRYGYT